MESNLLEHLSENIFPKRNFKLTLFIQNTLKHPIYNKQPAEYPILRAW